MSLNLYRLKEATEKRKAALGEAEENAEDAFQSLKRLSSLIDDPQFDAPPVIKSVARRNLKKIVSDVDDAKKKFDEQQRAANITEHYWKQVKTAREALNEELEILFPNVNINDKRFSVNEEAFDLFVLYMYNKVNFLQKELAKLQVNQNSITPQIIQSKKFISQKIKLFYLLKKTNFQKLTEFFLKYRKIKFLLIIDVFFLFFNIFVAFFCRQSTKLS